MHHAPRQIALFIALTAVLAGACDTVGPRGDDDLDRKITDLLAQEGGAEAFLLPSANDFDAIPQDPRNPITAGKVRLGKLLFHETALATGAVRRDGAGTYSCATCHAAGAGFEAGLRQALGEGGIGFGRAGEGRRPDPSYREAEIDAQPIRTLSPLNGAWQRVAFWNGQFGAAGPNEETEDRWRIGSPQAVNRLGYLGLEAQAIAALETHRMAGGPAAVAAAYDEYSRLFEDAFGMLPDGDLEWREVAGLAIAAYERTLIANRAPFQRWLRGDRGALSDAEKRGALLFFGRAGCVACHRGPALGSDAFHALGMGDMEPIVGNLDLSDPVQFGRGGFTGLEQDNFQFKTPQLYNVSDRPALGHGATFRSVRDVIEYKNHAIPENRYVSEHRISSHFRPLRLSEQDVRDLTSFLERGLRDPDLARYVPGELPSGRCFPANDRQSRHDLGCTAPGGESAETETHPGAGEDSTRTHGAVPYPLLSTTRGELP